MHSQKMMKVLGAGLTAAALTLGAAAPALATVTFDEPTVTVNSGDKESLSKSGDTAVVLIPVTSDDDSTMISNGGLKFEVDAVNKYGLLAWVEHLSYGDEGSYDSAKISYLDNKGQKITNLSSSMDKLGFIEITHSFSGGVDFKDASYYFDSISMKDADGKVTFVPEETSWEVKGTKDFHSVEIDKLEATKDGVIDASKSGKSNVSFTVTIGGLDTSVSGEAKLTYVDPAGDDVEVTGSISGGEFDEAIESSTSGFASTGYYTLKSIEVVGNDNCYWKFTEDLEAGDILVVNGKETTVYRLYNPNSGEHFYTVKSGEKDLLVEAGWKYEGVAFTAVDKDNNDATEVFRVYNPNGGDHHYTMSSGEVDLLVAAGWRNEGVAFYSYGTTMKQNANARVYRVYNPNAETGSHHYTLSSGERDALVSAGWNDEGTGWFAVKPSSN